MAIRVTVTDTETGDTDTAEIDNDYVIVSAGTCRIHRIQEHGNGTTVITVKGAKRKAAG